MSEINFNELRKPFSENDIEWRLQSCGESKGKIWGKVLAYVTNRAIQNRLDEVVGPANWKNEFQKGPDGGILCGLSIKVDNEWVTKWDGAENTQVEAVKGGLSDSMKRCAVQWGMGRYLYNLKENWAIVSDKGEYSGKTKEGKWFNWNPPRLPDWALPTGEPKKLQLSPEAEREHDKAIQDIVLKIEQYDSFIPEDRKERIQVEINNKNLPYLQTVLNWCVEKSKEGA